MSVLLAAPMAVAQTETPAPAKPSEAPAEAAPVQAAEAPATTPAPAPDQPSAKESEMAEKIESLQTKVAGLEETNAANQAAIASASKLKFSGFVQGRYEWHQDATNGATFNSSGAATATNTDRFLVRHAYLTTTYKGTNAEYVMQLDANNKDGVVFKDVYASFVDTWTPLNMKLSVGQFKYPFGYELLQSDAEREMPERATIEKFFFDGERDRGVRLMGNYDFFNFSVALVNGTIWDGSKNLAANKDPASPYPFGSNDPNEFKDWVGRLGVDFGDIVGGVSGYFGKGLYIAPPTTNASDPTKNTPATPDSRYKYRLGADLQTYIDVPGVGGLALKGELIYGKDTARQYHGIAADPCKSSATWGFILTAVQNISGDFGIVARFDGKDTLSSSYDSSCTTQKAAADKDRVLTVGGGLLYYASANVKATVTYEHPTEQAGAKKDNDFAMAQLQARF
jgi:Phosphate-selective porin O and P